MIELISSNWKVIATYADSYITDKFFCCKRVIDEWTHTRHNCESSRTHQYTLRQEVNKNSVTCVSSLPLNMREYNCSKHWLSETIFGPFLWPVEHVGCNSNCSRYFIKYSRIWKTNNLIDDLDRDVTYHYWREYFSLWKAINKPQRWSSAKVHVNGRSIL